MSAVSHGYPRNTPALIWLGTGALLLLVAVAITVGLVLYRFRQAADYPGAALVSDHTISALLPTPHIRRDTSYRTADDLPKVYNWYSSAFNLGPERRALSGCIHLYKSSHWLAFTNDVSVAICDTPKGRMMFVMRTVSLKP